METPICSCFLLRGRYYWVVAVSKIFWNVQPDPVGKMESNLTTCAYFFRWVGEKPTNLILFVVGSLSHKKQPINTFNLIWFKYPIIYKVLGPFKRWFFGVSEPSTVWCLPFKLHGRWKSNNPRKLPWRVMENPPWMKILVVVSNMVYFHPYLGKIPILTNGLIPPRNVY